MAAALKMTPHELYDWERAIRDDGQFSGARSGPGGGTPATPENVSLFLIALLGSSTKRNAGRLASVFKIGASYVLPDANSRHDHYKESCPLTGQRTLGDTLTVLLALPKKARDVDRIEVDCDVGTFTIWEKFTLNEQSHTLCHLFALPDADEKEVPPIRTVRILSGDALRAIAEAMTSDEDTNV
ncbi:hypothetical protein FZ983_16830 [Azospirillum sp. B21]|uniref:hypothetical protein n=1 Tax=Azospirillum sp. B21 TaxID=2607496 RepID=UPI00125BF4FB|nr:hypothetical protein [Azospirillum sp. B21]KAA0578990.1 hypothetical protein FZ983_16830 [Azospirillum sp. B21]